MNHADFIRELKRSPSHAVLSASDLTDMAKRASDMFLCQDTPLNDAVVKVASAYPGISQEQVKRIVELTNSETFQRLFEKQAEKRNVEFTIADPSAVLRTMDSGASAPIMKVASADYASAPISTQRFEEIEADLALCEMFGVTPDATPAMKKTAMGRCPHKEKCPHECPGEDKCPDTVKKAMMDPARGQAALQLLARNEQAAKAQKKVIETLMQPPEVAPPPSPDQLGIQGMAPQPQAQLGGMQPGGMMPKMSQMGGMGLGTGGGMGMGASGVPGGGMGASGALGGAGPVMDEGGVIPGEPGSRQPVDAMGGEIIINPAEEGLTPEQVFEAITEKKEEVQGGSEVMEEIAPEEEPVEDPGSVKEALAHVKLARPGAELVKQDLEQYLSVENIKTAARRNVNQYPDANPFGDLVRTRQTLEKQAEDVQDAIDENEHHWKIATAELGYNVVQHLMGEGNIGEVAHLMGGLGTQDQVKVAMGNLMPAIERRLPPWQITTLQAGLVEYEMEKGASARVVNPEHPITKSFSGVLKLSNDHDVLKEAQAQILPLLKKANSMVSKAAKTRVKA